jgi:hypothetical protein
MRDSSPPDGVSAALHWATYGSNGTLLHQYANERALVSNSQDGVYDLSPLAWEGTGHVVFNHSLYYQKAGTWQLVRFDLRQQQVTAVNHVHHRGAVYFGSERLYQDVPGAMDFAVDETGLWVVYANHRDPAGMAAMGYADWNNSDVFFLARIDPEHMTPVKIFKLRVPMTFRGNGFMVCGTLYIVRHSDRHKTSIAWAFDAYTEMETNPRLPFSNPYGQTAQLSYDPRGKEILAWDSGRLVLYPMLLKDEPLV